MFQEDLCIIRCELELVILPSFGHREEKYICLNEFVTTAYHNFLHIFVSLLDKKIIKKYLSVTKKLMGVYVGQTFILLILLKPKVYIYIYTYIYI